MVLGSKEAGLSSKLNQIKEEKKKNQDPNSIIF